MCPILFRGWGGGGGGKKKPPPGGEEPVSNRKQMSNPDSEDSNVCLSVASGNLLHATGAGLACFPRVARAALVNTARASLCARADNGRGDC